MDFRKRILNFMLLNFQVIPNGGYHKVHSLLNPLFILIKTLKWSSKSPQLGLGVSK